MNKKYERYIDYIVNDLQAPYFKNMENQYGLRPEEYEMVLSKVFNQPVTIKGDYVYNQLGDMIYYEDSTGYWEKYEYDNQGNEIYHKDSDGYWVKLGYDNQGNQIYKEDADGYWEKNEYDDQGNEVYYENSDGEIEDNR
jgi:hypothetical protein